MNQLFWWPLREGSNGRSGAEVRDVVRMNVLGTLAPW
jgi:hypothetical protein